MGISPDLRRIAQQLPDVFSVFSRQTLMPPLSPTVSLTSQ